LATVCPPTVERDRRLCVHCILSVLTVLVRCTVYCVLCTVSHCPVDRRSAWLTSVAVQDDTLQCVTVLRRHYGPPDHISTHCPSFIDWTHRLQPFVATSAAVTTTIQHTLARRGVDANLFHEKDERGSQTRGELTSTHLYHAAVFLLGEGPRPHLVPGMDDIACKCFASYFTRRHFLSSSR